MKTMIKSVVVLATICLLASPALASMNIKVDYSGYTRYGNGGPFLATVGPASDNILRYSANMSFTTFCVETTEFINVGGVPATWYVVGLSDNAQGGGLSGRLPGEDHDHLSNAAANLYLNYQAMDTSAKSANSAAYQQAIWFLEDEITTGNALSTWAIGQYGEKTEAYEGNLVRVMNLTDGGTRKQDLLVSQVPVPGAALLGLIGLSIVGWVKRRFA